MSWQYFLNSQTFFFFNQTLYGYASSRTRVSCRKKHGFHLQGQGHGKGLCDQSMTVYTISSKLLIFLHPNLMIYYHKPDCPMKKWDDCVHSQGHSKGSKSQWMFVQMNCSTLVRWCIIIHWSVMQKMLVCHLQGQGLSKGLYDQHMTVSTVPKYDCFYYIKIWLFLLYLIWPFLLYQHMTVATISKYGCFYYIKYDGSYFYRSFWNACLFVTVWDML